MKKVLSLIAVIILASFLVGFGYTWYTKPPEIYTSMIELPYGKELQLTEIQVSDDVNIKKIIKGNINSKKIGTQHITIQVTNKRNISTRATIRVSVVDKETPVIQVKDMITTEAKTPFELKNFITVTDNADGNILQSLTISPYTTDHITEQKIILTATDSSQNKTEKTITLKVVDTTKPVIQAQNHSITEGEFFDVKKGVKAEDNIDGDLTSKIEIVGTVNCQKAGAYPITYKVNDRSNNEVTKNITVKVKKKLVAINSNPVTVAINGKYAPLTLYFNGISLPYKNGGKPFGQRIIDTGRRASTWGGASVFSGTDGLNTHFIGHNPGPFHGIQNAKQFVIADAKGNVFTYVVTRVYKVNVQAIGVNDGVNYWNRITGTGGGERVTFQSCYNDSTNWIIEASLQK